MITSEFHYFNYPGLDEKLRITFFNNNAVGNRKTINFPSFFAKRFLVKNVYLKFTINLVHIVTEWTLVEECFTSQIVARLRNSGTDPF